MLLRLPQDPLPAELPLLSGPAAGSRWLVPGLALAAVAWLLATRWIGSDADTKWNEYLAPLLAGGALLFLWCVGWGLASKLFTGRFTLTPHLRLALMFGLAMQALDLLLMVLAYSLDWPLAEPPAARCGLRGRRGVADATPAPGAAQAHPRRRRRGWRPAQCSASRSPW